MRKFLIYFIIFSSATALGLAAINWKVDPYAIFQTRGGLAKGEVSPLLTLNERVFKTVLLARENPAAIILGTSRADIGMDPDHPALGGKRAANLATFGQPIAESRQLLALAASGGGLKTAVVGLDFFAFNALFPYPSDFDTENFAESRPLQLAFSVTTSLDSWKYRKRARRAAGDCCLSNGARYPNRPDQFVGHYRSHFMSSERMYLLEKYLPSPGCAFSFAGRKHASTLDELRAMMALAHAKNIALKLFVSPSHARQWEVVASAGLWAQWQQWKRELVRINGEEAARAGRNPFPLWDFSGYNAITTEAVPREGDLQTRMRWYSDSSHYVPALGRVILDKMFAQPVSASNIASSIPDDFGVLLTPATLDTQLAAIRRGHAEYRVTHPADVAEIAGVAAEAAHRKYCAASAR